MKKYKSSAKIKQVETTSDTLTGRGGLALFVKYLSRVNIFPVLEEYFGKMRKSSKGQEIWNIFKQVTIIVQMDSGFFDEDNFSVFDALNIGFITRGA